MGKLKYDLTNAISGYLIAREYLGQGNWRCECTNCGNKDKIVRSENFRSGKIISCGCIKKVQTNRAQKNSYCILTARGQRILADVEDLMKLSKYIWNIGSDGYPRAVVNGKATIMHDFLLSPNYDPELLIEHKNRDKTDNRKENLRIAAQKSSLINKRCSVNIIIDIENF